MNYYYENDMFRLEGVSKEHTISDIDIYIGKGILKNTSYYVQKRNLGKKCLIVADNNTYHAAGMKLSEILNRGNIETDVCLLRDRENERIEADELAIGQVMMSLEPEPDFLIACGSGVINDITRFVSFITKKPFVSIGTAASMDGYTSVTSPMIFDRKKVHRHGSAPKILVLDTEVLKNAPTELTVAGFGDVYGKYIAKADWLLSNITTGEEVDKQALSLITQALAKLTDNVEEIRNATDEGLKAIIEGLILAGITIFTTGQTRAVASVEHNQGHIWETRMLEAEKPYALHGTAVGCSTGYYLRMYEYFKKIDISSLDREKAKHRILNREAFRKQVVKCFGESFLSVLEKSNKCLNLTEEDFENHYNSIVNNWDKIIKVLDFLPSWDEYKNIYKKFGQTIHAEEIGIPTDLLTYTLPYSTFYRDRYDFVFVMNILGVIEDITEKTLKDYQKEK
ncbi:MAG: sn-glycerol-1-phosphate dehydrogenase [Clostridiaceae bacterium]|nr:sn-glycerol-1-phosphate dehydrogenase [Clostridiaceae bacterium]